MTDKALVRQEGMVVVATTEGLIRPWWHSIVVPPSAPFILESVPMGVLKGGDNIVGGDMPSFMVFSQVGPAVTFYVTDTKEFFQAVLELRLWCLSVRMARREFTAQYDSR